MNSKKEINQSTSTDLQEHNQHNVNKFEEAIVLKAQEVRHLSHDLSDKAVSRLSEYLLGLDGVFDPTVDPDFHINEVHEQIIEDKLNQRNYDQRIADLCEKILPTTSTKPPKDTEDEDSLNYLNPSNHGRSLLHQAVLDNNLALVKTVVYGGASTLLRDTTGNTALQIAVNEGFSTIIQFLKNK